MKRRVTENARRRAAGFTLVEILVAIAIIGMLAALIGVAANGAMRRAREAVLSTELSLLHNAMNEFKSTYGSYPPSLGTPLVDNPPTSAVYTSEKLTQRQSRIVRFVNKAFPRLVLNQSTPYDDLRTMIAGATLTNFNFSNPPLPSSSLTAAGGPLNTVPRGCCDLNTLDPAEALVFWLGGLPRRRAGSNGGFIFEVTGFSANATAPFRVQLTTAEFGSGDPSWRNQGFVNEQRTPLLFPTTEQEIRFYLAGNLCRCTGYDKIVRAVQDAAGQCRGGHDCSHSHS